MTVWLDHGPLGSPGAGYGYDGLVLVPFNVHVSPTRATSHTRHTERRPDADGRGGDGSFAAQDEDPGGRGAAARAD